MPKAQRHGAVETQSAEIDVLLLDVLAQIESLLRNGRDLQRALLRLRGVPSPTTGEQQRKAASRAELVARSMLDESLALSKVVRHLRGRTTRLKHRVRTH
jgi:hypothetical protein